MSESANTDNWYDDMSAAQCADDWYTDIYILSFADYTLTPLGQKFKRPAAIVQIDLSQITIEQGRVRIG